MKKKISLTSLIMIVCFSIVCLFGCSTNEKAQTENETEKINDSTLGTWQSVKANIENSEFTMEELETMVPETFGWYFSTRPGDSVRQKQE